jgi:hypothetical protein
MRVRLEYIVHLFVWSITIWRMSRLWSRVEAVACKTDTVAAVIFTLPQQFNENIAPIWATIVWSIWKN